jgi:hypothetical protein
LHLHAGVWEFVSSKEAIDIVAECATPEEACKAVSVMLLSSGACPSYCGSGSAAPVPAVLLSSEIHSHVVSIYAGYQRQMQWNHIARIRVLLSTGISWAAIKAVRPHAPVHACLLVVTSTVYSTCCTVL